MMLTGTAPSIDSLSFSNPYVSSGSVSGDFAGMLSDSTPGAYYSIEIDTNGDQMPEVSGMTGSPGSFSIYGSMPLSTTSVMARAVEMDSTTWQYVYGAWQPFTVNTGVVVNTLPTIASLTFANPSAAYGSVTGQFVGSVTDATPSYSYNIEVDTNGDEVSEFSFGAYSGSFNLSYWLPLHVTSVNARAVEYDSALGQSVSGGWQAFGIDNGVIANTLPTVDGLTFSGSYAAFGYATGFFTGTVSDATPSSSSYTIEMYTNMNPVSAIVGSSGAGGFNLMASILVGTTTVVARAKEFVYATGQTVIGDWQTFTISDGVVANTMPTLASLEFTNPAASLFSVTGLFVGSLTDATPGASYSIEIDTNNNGTLDATGYTTTLGSFSVDGTIPVGVSSVRARVIETISATNELAYGDWEDFSVSGSGSGSGTGSSSSSISPSFVENLVASLLLANPNSTGADIENALFAYFDSLNLGFSLQSLISLAQQFIASSNTQPPNGLSSTTPNSTTPNTPAAVAAAAPAAVAPAAPVPAAAAPPATNPEALPAWTGPIPNSQALVPFGPIHEIEPVGMPLYRKEGSDNKNYYHIASRMAWDGQQAKAFDVINGLNQGRFLYNHEVRAIVDSRTVNLYSYVDQAVLDEIQVNLDAAIALKVVLEADVVELTNEQSRLNQLSIDYNKCSALYAFAGTIVWLSFGITPTPIVVALYAASLAYSIASSVVAECALEVGRNLSAASSAVMTTDGRIAGMKSQLRDGIGLPRLYNTFATQIEHVILGWKPTDLPRQLRWENCNYSSDPGLNGTSNNGLHWFDEQFVWQGAEWVNMPDAYKISVN